MWSYQAKVAILLPHRNVKLDAVVVVYCMSPSLLVTLSPLNLRLPKTAQGCAWLTWFEVLTFFSKSKGRSSFWNEIFKTKAEDIHPIFYQWLSPYDVDVVLCFLF